ncbi:hypothetical protein DL240_09135 [Lujinxingia litoralis]|uniref:Peptidase C51 domain-containing protein n=1 Tax=Lujinxingia litoralis TaxID=2211119 RepID=A0A328C699_9DELT|nr:hypothetical protein [Lujinxingia litoralis]RAL23039.1 hypothetical protein DL240_09135 [Lujinxingia litoralis]
MPLIPTEGARLRRALLSAALSEWERGVECRRDATRISRYFRDCGWQWHLDQHAGGAFDEDLRRASPHLEYCGLFVAFCGLHLGHHLEPERCVPVRLRPGIAELVLPSTFRAQSARHWARAGVAAPPPLEPGEAALHPGDIITLRTRSRAPRPYGDHFAIVHHAAGDTVHTVEANAVGPLGPDKEMGRGVIRGKRPLRDVRRIYRLRPEHIEEVC